MVFSEIMKLPALRHCKGDNRLFFLLCLLCGFLLQGGSFFRKIGFHTRKVLPKRPGLSFCNGIDVYLNAADCKTVLVKGIEQIILAFPSPVLHHHIKVRSSFLQTSAPASGYCYIYKLYIYLILINFRLQISVDTQLYILLCLPVDAMK